ncbi:MAG: molybdopterin-dependent oxidoreductase, partial [Nitrospiraceae bacterium]|nr:molybdopterin-dependent oxidoreductase [Nitrospiraceae bacterium]
TSHHVAYEFASGKFQENKTLTKGSTDLPNCEFVLWFGSDPCAANFPFVAQSRKLIEMLQRGGKLAVVDPRCNVAASKADWWLPIVPGADAALALAIGRIIIDNGWHNIAFLQRPHGDAASPTGELNVTDATRLVKLDGNNGHATAYLRADEAAIPGGTADDFVVWSTGGGKQAAAARYNTVDAGELLPGTVEVNGIQCKTAFQLYADEARSRTLEEYAAICGIEVETIQAIASELVSHGRRVSVEFYRGSVQHTNGTYTGWAIINLNTLVGNYNWKGGHVFGGSHWHEMGGKPGNRFAPATVVGGVSNSGVRLTRAKHFYQDSTEFANYGYPARRPWFPFAFHLNYQEIVPSIEDGYPYPTGALILYWNDVAYSTPAAKTNVQRVLADEQKVPLIVSIDILMGETTAYADYILPDTTYLERWSTPHVGSAINTKVSGVRQPVVGSFTNQMDYIPVLPNTKTMEDILIGLAKAMGLPLDGQDVDGNPVPIDRAWDWHRQLISNIGDEGGGPGLDYVLARGGRFEGHDGLYDGERMAHRFSGGLYFFNETLAQTGDSITGEPYEGFAKYLPIADSQDNPITDEGFPLRLTTYKQGWHSMARTINNPWLVSILPENFVEINRGDAIARGIQTGDVVRVRSLSLPQGAKGLAYVTETIRPGVVAIAHSFGHWEMASRAHEINGTPSSFSALRGAGIAANPIMREDPVFSNVTLQDKVGGSASYYDTFVEVAKV